MFSALCGSSPKRLSSPSLALSAPFFTSPTQCLELTMLIVDHKCRVLRELLHPLGQLHFYATSSSNSLHLLVVVLNLFLRAMQATTLDFFQNVTTKATMPCLLTPRTSAGPSVKQHLPRECPTHLHPSSRKKKNRSTKRHCRSVRASRSPRPTIHNKVRRPRKAPCKHDRTTEWCVYTSSTTSHSQLFQPILEGDGVNAATVGVSQARKTTAHLTFKTKVQFISLQQQCALERLSRNVHPTSAPSFRRRASVVAQVHSPQRFNQRQRWALQVLFTNFCVASFFVLL